MEKTVSRASVTDIVANVAVYNVRLYHRQCVLAQMLFMVGPYLQAELGWRMFLGLYFVAGVAANVAEYIGNVLIRYCSICPCYLTGLLEKGLRSPLQPSCTGLCEALALTYSC